MNKGTHLPRMMPSMTSQSKPAVAWHAVCRFCGRAPLVLALVLLFLPPTFAAPMRIAVVLSVEGASYREFASALGAQLDPALFSLSVGTDAVAPDNADLYVAVGTKATAALANTTRPVLSVLTPRSAVDALNVPSSFAAIYIDQPVSRRLALIAAVLPQARSVGVLYSSSLPAELPMLQRAAAAAGLTLNSQEVVRRSDISPDLAEVLSKSDVFLVLADTEIYRPDTLRNILLQTYRQRVPMIGLSSQYVRAGALCAVYTSPRQIAQQAARAIRRYSASGHLPASRHPEDFEVAVNTQVARSLGLNIQDAEQLRAFIGRQK
ncbi:MAG: hypothetical protein GW825_03305 [Gallionella sp.]|nr:hypothetical protein [Gallionella sp.]NCS74863.1 hypothetical protein [Gallionella sp.]PIR10177.1 MAG: hypothetical protein COV51_00645 [Gallionellaceae bacterium CG11_big_fil_rev_8_21_14_0_20_60_62]PIV47705.1 MAG: hypothetical protein COS20_03430 [Gallionellaceae bacterium CG02_land_8_20_14_3_00_60_115]PJC04174.1 MAG: hypothetical protein CO069_04445 [Gallionellaceae bacterium CG_4_9_14_0_8_um_filter_60_335]